MGCISTWIYDEWSSTLDRVLDMYIEQGFNILAPDLRGFGG